MAGARRACASRSTRSSTGSWSTSRTPSCASTVCISWARSARLWGAVADFSLIEDSANGAMHAAIARGVVADEPSGSIAFGAGSAEGRRGHEGLLGGKGANLAEMSQLGLPVPPGFTITTEVCTYFYDHDRRYPERADASRCGGARPGRAASSAPGFGDPERPLLVSVRSGAPVSMPGMMDTVLNLGLNDRTVRAWPRAASDRASPTTAIAASSRCTATSCWASITTASRRRSRTSSGPERLPASTPSSTRTPCCALVERLQAIVLEDTGKPFPQDAEEQLWGAIGAVFGSWMTPRAVTYRRLHDIPDDMGTAVSVQAMVFGNMGERLRHRGRLHPQSVDRRKALLRRVPDQRPGRGRGRRHPHAAAADPRHGQAGGRRQAAALEEAMPAGLRRARERVRAARGALPRHAGHRVHDPAGPALRSCRPATASAPPRAALKVAVDMARGGR